MVTELKEKEQIFSQLEKIINHRFDKKEEPIIRSFINEYYRDVAWEDLAERELDDLYGAAIAHWNLAQSRQGEESKVNVYNPDFETHGWQSPYSIIEIVTMDRPFLLNSLTMNLNQSGLTCHLVVHPIIEVVRDENGLLKPGQSKERTVSESMIRLEVDRQASKGGGLELLADQVQKVITYNTAVNEDWKASINSLQQSAEMLKEFSPKDNNEDIDESLAFLSWLKDDNFLFLGCREYELVKGNESDGFKIVEGSGKGILRDKLAAIPQADVIPITDKACDFMSEPCPLIVTKATTKSIIHRPAYMDYVGVKKFNKHGEVIGEYRFLGLYTSAAYLVRVREIPLIRKKISKVFAKSNFKENSHSGKSLMNVLEDLPRDELFHSNDEQLLSLALGVLKLKERQRTRVFARIDAYGRFVSMLVYVPRDRYNTMARKKMEQIICAKLQTDSVDFNVQFSESIFARIHFMVHTNTDWVGEFDVSEVESEIIEALRDWKDDLLSSLVHRHGETKGTELWNRYGDGFTSAYKDNYPARFAVADIEKAERLKVSADQQIQMSLYQPLESHGEGLQFKLINKGVPAPLSQTLPVLENMGVTVFDERPFEVTDLSSQSSYWVHDFGLVYNTELPDIESIKENFQLVFEKVWTGNIENDGFNQLVIKANLDWKQIMLLRAYYMYLRQAGITFSQAYVQQTLQSNPIIAGHLVRLFELRFDPFIKAKKTKIGQQEAEILAEIETVVSLDEDRILRRYLNLIQSTLRTNYYQCTVDSTGVPYLSFKLNPEALTELPSPRPKFEIFVYSPRVEGVHLRGGSVARGGLRWSDRKEDFRTEILGLMKAQMSKNAVIVPTGAKGGFIVKRSLDGLTRDEMMEEVVACYSIFIGALLDITDNLKGEKVIPPHDVVRYDDDDPYLVVAADKGTATFSDIANNIAIERDFWLGDAFASGGSVGYDHKKMGITAKGAWESVKRHFREIGVDTQTTPFSVIGIGDMAGDVFGNGMLLSEKIRLIGAFNHMHIFLDPDPDISASFEERKRLFKLPRSSWSDYDKALISKGGGVFSRADKSIALTPPIQKLLGVSDKVLTPNNLIRAMLKAPVDLLWNGGIGTYVKSSIETDADVGDRANDALRVNGRELACKVVGEGGNLGFTQLGRIEYAAKGRINTDAIDNAAGVDCSDHEVNIKILLNKLVEQGDMTIKQRNALLAKMTDEVSTLVLRNNYLQTQAITMVESQSSDMLEVHGRLINQLGQEGRLDRTVEFLPSQEEIEERKAKGEGLHRPELAVIFAYSKLLLKDLMKGASVIQDENFKQELLAYFPSNLRDKFVSAIEEHRLRDDIIVNQVVNSMVNRLGPSFAFRMKDEAGACIDEVIKNYKIACEIFNIEVIWSEIEALDNKVSPKVQIDMLMNVRKLVERTMYWLQRNRSQVVSVTDVTDEFAKNVSLIGEKMITHASDVEKEHVEQRAAYYQEGGVDEVLANKIACLELEFVALDIIAVNSIVDRGIEDVLSVYSVVSNELKLSWLHGCISYLPRKNYWQSLARSALRDELHAENRALLTAILKSFDKGDTTEKRLTEWCSTQRADIDRYLHLVSLIQAESEMEIEQLSVILKKLHLIVEKSKAMIS
ncbi:NAD-glutamate dehydrogenase [uncultured Cycloclasticus sp.]|jgi:glutamate dehydrogenase|uniref:NAD-glutamate dehydrogenase n=1 Tax=uncultured Cycloclasticus sp. TaxID=172194 RepID=UPI00258C5A8D|nr:NAD-glutamate dehydrogenase [uncultured Cycloclasticus sp.]